MSAGWPKVQLGEVLAARSDSLAVDPSASYPNVGILSFGRGLFEKPPINGNSSSATKLYRIEAGQLIYSRLFAFEGAYGIVPPEFDGHFVSNEFPTFNCRPDRVCPEYLGWLFRRPHVWDEIASRAIGVGDRRRIHPEALLRYEIPLPPIEEQRRIVARIEALAAEIDHARTLRHEAVDECETLLVSMAHRTDLDENEKLAAGWREATLSEVINLSLDLVAVQTDAFYPNFGIYSFGNGLFHKTAITGISTSAKFLTRAHAGQFIFSRLFAFEGAYGIVTADFNGKYVSNEYPTFDCDRRSVLPEFLRAYFKPKSVSRRSRW